MGIIEIKICALSAALESMRKNQSMVESKPRLTSILVALVKVRLTRGPTHLTFKLQTLHVIHVSIAVEQVPLELATRKLQIKSTCTYVTLSAKNLPYGGTISVILHSFFHTFVIVFMVKTSSR